MKNLRFSEKVENVVIRDTEIDDFYIRNGFSFHKYQDEILAYGGIRVLTLHNGHNISLNGLRDLIVETQKKFTPVPGIWYYLGKYAPPINTDIFLYGRNKKIVCGYLVDDNIFHLQVGEMIQIAPAHDFDFWQLTPDLPSGFDNA